jgi:hypothetical protein
MLKAAVKENLLLEQEIQWMMIIVLKINVSVLKIRHKNVCNFKLEIASS